MKTSKLHPLLTLSRLALATLATVILAQHTAKAATQTWKNTVGNTNFNAGTSWVSGTPPANGSSDIALFSANKAYNPNLSASLSIGEVSFNSGSGGGSGYDFTASNSSALTLTAATAINCQIRSGTNTFDVPLVFGAASGTQTISVGDGNNASSGVLTFGTGTGGGGITINSGLTLNVSFASTTTGQANYATVNLNSAIGSTGAITLGLATNSAVFGNINLNGTNTYSGTTTVGNSGANPAVITLGNKSVFGTSAVGFGGNVQASADLSGANAIVNNTTINSSCFFQGTNNIELSGSMNGNGRTLTNNISGGILKISGNVGIYGTDAVSKTFSIAGSGNTTISGIIDDNQAGTHTNAGAIAYSGAGTLTLTGSNTFTGATTISSGTISVSSLNSVGVGGSSNLGAPGTTTNGRITLGSTGPITGTLLYTGAGGETTDRVIRMVGNGVVQNDGGGPLVFTSAVMAAQGAPVTLTLSGSNTGNSTFSGGISNGSITNTTAVIKAGTGKWILSGTNTYTGGTTVNGGTLILAGSVAGNAVVNSTGILGAGSGTISGTTTVNSGGTLYPGATTTTTHTLTLNNNVAFNDGSTLNINLDDTAHTVDLLTIDGTLTITGSDTLTLSLVNGALTSGQTYTIATFTSETGTFSTVDPQIATAGYQVIYNPTSIQLTLVPEPGSWVMIISGFGLLISIQRLRRRQVGPGCCTQQGVNAPPVGTGGAGQEPAMRLSNVFIKQLLVMALAAMISATAGLAAPYTPPPNDPFQPLIVDIDNNAAPVFTLAPLVHIYNNDGSIAKTIWNGNETDNYVNFYTYPDGTLIKKSVTAKHGTFKSAPVYLSGTYCDDTIVYAQIMLPAGAKAGDKFPGILFLHGGGYYAQNSSEYYRVKAWAAAGYVVVACDLPGIADPTYADVGSGTWRSVPYASIPRMTVTPDIKASWIYTAEATALKAFALLKNQPNTDQTKMGITGESWGGFSTTLLCGLLGDRVKAGFSMFGCGFIDEQSAWHDNFDPANSLFAFNNSAEAAQWLTYLDPGRRAGNIKANFYLASPANDHFYRPSAAVKTAQAITTATSFNYQFSPNSQIDPNDTNPAHNLDYFIVKSSHHILTPGGDTIPPTFSLPTVGRGWCGMEAIYFDYLFKGIGAPLSAIKLAGNPQLDSQNNLTINFTVGRARFFL